MRENFNTFIINLREFEGFKSNDPDDPGEHTVYGISEYYHPEMYPEGKEPTWAQAEAFYLRLWIDNGCDDLPSPVDWIHGDSCVNPGPGAAKGFRMWSAEHKDPTRQSVEYAILRLRYYLKVVRQRPVSLKYLAGWMDRTLDFLERGVITTWDMEVL